MIGNISLALKLNSVKSFTHSACKDSESAFAGVFKRPPIKYQDSTSDKLII